MKKKTILNSLMVLIIVLIAVCALMAVKTLKGTGDSSKVESENPPLSVSKKIGIVTVERSGIAYEVEDGAAVRSGDRFRSKKGAQLYLQGEDSQLVLGANSEVEVDADQFYLHSGELFAESNSSIELQTEEVSFTAEQAVLTISAQRGSQTIYVYAGEIEAAEQKIKAGERLSIVEQEDGTVETEITAFAASALNDAQIKLLQNCEFDGSFCFSKEELTQVVTLRQEEKAKAQQAQLLLADESKAALEKEQQEYDKALAESQKPQTSTVVTTTPSTTQPTTGTTEQVTDGEVEAEDDDEEKDQKKYVTIEIRCDTILDNMENLTAGKDIYVPGSGTILATSKIEFEEGETVFEVLNRACDRADIQIEYRWTPMYGSYYIEGINHLYEFDCGDESGWMYKVNGWFPNYGCSSYVLEEDDVIVWSYTCNGLGRDLGFEGF